MPLGLVPDIGYRVQRTFLTSDWVRARFIACPTCRVRKYPPPRVLSFALAFIRPAVALAWPIRRRHHLHNTPPYKDRKGRQARARYCGVVWRGVVWCGVVWCGVVWCGVVWCGVNHWTRATTIEVHQPLLFLSGVPQFGSFNTSPKN